MEDKQLYEIINDFNEALLSLSYNVANIFPDSLIGNNIKDIEKSIKNKKNFTKFIDLFTTKILQYKDEIENSPEIFFNRDYESELKNYDTSYLEKIISLKSVWNKLKNENKNIVVSYMNILCDLSQEYFDITVQ